MRVLVLGLVLLTAGCGGGGGGLSSPTATAASLPPGSTSSGLRALAAGRGRTVGAAVDQRAFLTDAAYTEALAREFDLLVPETAMNFRFLQPERGRYDFSRADAMVDFAERHGMRVMGHTLLWNVNPPAWLSEGRFGREELLSIMRDHVRTVVGRYRGRAVAWVVVNEAVANPTGPALPGLQNSVWLGIGPDYIEHAFRAAHEADPAARLYYNDYGGEGMGRKSDAIYALLQGLVNTGVPVHGVGLQMHLDEAGRSAGTPVNAGEVSANLQRLADLGLEVRVTELDVALDLRPGPPSASRLAEQARLHGEMVGACLRQPRCSGVTFWGFTDRVSWIPLAAPGFGAGHLFDEALQPKPAYAAVREAFAAP